jgi:hypothetical protein
MPCPSLTLQALSFHAGEEAAFPGIIRSAGSTI